MPDHKSLQYIIHHVFLPPQLPQGDDTSVACDHALSSLVLSSAERFQRATALQLGIQWNPICKMLSQLCESMKLQVLPADLVEKQMKEMKSGDILVFLIRAQNAAIILRKYDSETTFESFELSPTTAAVMVPSTVADDPKFQEEFSLFLAKMNTDVLDDAVATTRKAKSNVREERETTDPRYIIQLLTGILRGVGRIAEIPRIRKRIGDDVLWNDARLPWRRSPLWLAIRVTMQTTLVRRDKDGNEYKSFMAFFMASILRMASKCDMQSDVLFCMRAKLSRRLYKLKSNALPFVSDAVNQVADEVESILTGRWRSVQEAQETSSRWAPQELNFIEDTCLSLTNSRDHLKRVMLDRSPQKSLSAFQPSHSPRTRGIEHFLSVDKNRLANIFQTEPFTALADFELSIEEGFDKWIDDVAPNDRHSACAVISNCMEEYFTQAQKHYAHNPEDMSIMILTLLELWVGMDKLAVLEHRLLADYSPEVPANLPELLLLRKSGSLYRLDQIQHYLNSRAHRAQSGQSVFTDGVRAQSFSVRFFESSAKHQELKRQIERDAAHVRDQKVIEMQDKNAEHERLTEEARNLEHIYIENRLGEEIHNKPGCSKCSKEKKIAGLKIQVHEWPLPEDTTRAKAVVFELDCPITFSIWRSTTYNLLSNILTPALSRTSIASPPTILTGYSALIPYLTSIPSRRITLASTTKPFTKSHYQYIPIPSSEPRVCLPNALSFRLFDVSGSRWAANAFTQCTRIERFCIPNLPAGPYQSLQYTVDGTSHSSNTVLSNQSQCHKELTIHEFIAFGSLRSGPLLQWMNILRELHARTLNLRREEVYTLMTQAAWQVGPTSGDGVREWHVDLVDVKFSSALLDELENFVVTVEENWLEDVSMRTIIALACRLLSVATDDSITGRTYTLLRKVRVITFRWIQQLSKKLHTIDNDPDMQTQEFQSRIRDLAATCRATYDVEKKHLRFLLRSSEDETTLLQCAIALHDNMPSNLQMVSPESKRLLDRDWRLSHFLEGVLSQRIIADGSGLNDAILAVWPGYRPGVFWSRLQHPHERWLISLTSESDNQRSQTVHFNLFEGQLLIDGKPLGRLPSSIIRHPTYSMLFGQKVLDIVPSDIQGMEFVTRGKVYDRQVYFSLRKLGKELVVRTKQGAELLEFIPRTTFLNDLPKLLVEDHTHWLNLHTGELQIRPDHYRLKGLEYPENLLVTHKPLAENSGPSLVVDLLRFRLSFFVDTNYHLQSRNLRGMVVDSNQSAGTLFGLRNQLLLRSSDQDLKYHSRHRYVLIPHGQLSFQRQGHHITIEIDTQKQHRVQHHRYKVDTVLGCLVGNVSLTNKLYKAYLHALSSSCLPDPLTGRTGTEEALYDLSSAGCQSFQALGAADIELLHQIGALTTNRTFYPAHLKRMQKVEWGKISPLAQHHGFYAMTNTILEFANRIQVFEEKPIKIHCSDRNTHLLQRAALRNAMFYPQEFTQPLPPHNGDLEYDNRASVGDAEASACDVASLIYQWPLRLATSHHLLDIFQQWKHVSGPQTLATPRYDSDWFEIKLSETWISLYDLFRRSTRQEVQYQLLFSLSAMVYGSPSTRNYIDTLLAFATNPDFKTIRPPLYSSYDLRDGFKPQQEVLLKLVTSCAHPFERSPEVDLEALEGESKTSLKFRRHRIYEEQKISHVRKAVEDLISQWPCDKPTCPSFISTTRFNSPTLMQKVKLLFLSCYKNKYLWEYTVQVQVVLDRAYTSTLIEKRPYRYRPSFSGNKNHCSNSITFIELFDRNVPDLDPPPRELPKIPESMKEKAIPKSTKGLQRLVSEFRNDGANAFHQLYGENLAESWRTMGQQSSDGYPSRISYSRSVLQSYLEQCEKHFLGILCAIHQVMSPQTPAERALLTAGQWPRITIRSLLRKLVPTSDTALTIEWKSVLSALAESLILFQRSQRLLAFAMSHKHEEFYKELENTGYGVYDSSLYPAWLLIQIENHFRVRPIQAEVAREMMSPASGHNTTLQLNMGEGKSSVIVPIAAAALADGDKLVRVVALKSLATQMFQLLVERLGGLTNRRIFYMPFSRSIKLDYTKVQLIQKMYEECRRVGGILVIQPDHILSYKLMSVDQHLASRSDVAKGLLESQLWLESHTRDILDESDEILHVRYQLVYTIGSQQHLEGFPERWTTTQQILSLARKHAPLLQQKYPLGIEVQQSPFHVFPQIRILQADAGEALISMIAQCVSEGDLANFHFGQLPLSIRQIVSTFITRSNLLPEHIQVIKGYCQGSGLWKGLLLLRGLLAHGILVYALRERRWRVDYGLDLQRSMLAVPYRAKDVPAVRAEFGHPDVAVILTCLSYYYGGLSEKELDICFQLLQKVDNPPVEYEEWIRGCDVPDTLRHISGLNARSAEQRNRYLIPLFQQNQAVVDFYLSRVVFPKEAKEFPQKLATSGWDIAERKSQITTGFSGTNDNRFLLPTSILQHDPPHQKSTNAKVLSYLLKEENNRYMCMKNRAGEHSLTESFLKVLVNQSPEIRVLLDVGAQMLELQNRDLAILWLSLKTDAQAAIFFNESDELTVVDRESNSELFISSPYNQQLDQCLLYLDDAHTRGTDVKLPAGFRAAVTLGPKVTKDRLAQGCMRMRKLGNGHSVMFFAPLEVDRRIRDAAKKAADEQIDALDILRWVMYETCTDIQQRASQWAQQGVDHRVRAAAWSRFSSGDISPKGLASAWLQQEARTLEEMYGLDLSHTHAAFDIPELRARCIQLGVLSIRAAGMEEEQEREVVHEIERERQIERPPKATAALHHVHKDVQHFVRTGVIPAGSLAIKPAFTTLAGTNVMFNDSLTWTPNLLVTADFATVIQSRAPQNAQDYLRPTHWILSAQFQDSLLLLVVSPHEANELLPEIRGRKKVRLHIYAPRVTQTMKPCDDLKLYCIPPLPAIWAVPPALTTQLNLWAGQLYLPNYETYERLCGFLGIYSKETSNAVTQSDGFIKPIDRPTDIRFFSPFRQSPVPCLKALIGLRRKGMGFLPTHMGKILQGRLLTDEDFDP
ncbi:hypothetical protein SERLADRAFT_413465 [Serpula lacrymans var. lacrymans S7.9]|uniref:ubiquitinyl hydrolase 1 n=1 Tax=Serpula lacrymans var. lacrymans (strain S7.9) TaxID=578457 RepID=F8NLT6_SERL9|nr:uncharacterized protein SERLADRAFT_413465 [Serpula lacrymans var. lacrymans S7.9]EGO28636.1 hypothetical protein SERLADRAFT_413465 [Serpula lacrymans var. lacrymans S7.9]